MWNRSKSRQRHSTFNHSHSNALQGFAFDSLSPFSHMAAMGVCTRFINILTMLLVVSSARAGTFYVDAGAGDDSATGATPASAFRTIQRAANVVLPGDSVVVAPGVYAESVQLSRAGTAAAPIVFRADTVARGRVIISGAHAAIRKGAVWTLEPAEGAGIYSTPVSHEPVRVLADDVDIFHYPTFAEMKASALVDVAKSGKPGPGPRGGWFASGGKIFLRLNPRHGSVNPASHVMKLGPVVAGGFRGDEVVRASDYNFGVLTTGAANVVIRGFTFETPGMCGVFTPKGGVTVQDCWFIGCRAGVAGTARLGFDDACADVTVEHCEHTEQGVMDDVREAVAVVEAMPKAQQALQHSLYWWHRKGGPSTYEYGLVAAAGTRWTVRRNYVHDTFDGLSFVSTSWSRGLEVAENVFANLVDNAVEMEEHAQGMRVHHNFLRDVWEPFSYQPTQLWPDLPRDAEFHHNVVWMRDTTADFWSQPSVRKVPGFLKVFSPGRNAVSPEIRVHHNTVWHPVGNFFNSANLFYEASNVSITDNVAVTLGTDLNQPGYRFRNFTFARNLVAPSTVPPVGFGQDKYTTLTEWRGPGAKVAGADGQALETADLLGLTAPREGDFRPRAGSVVAVAGAGAILPGETWSVPLAGPRVSAMSGATGAAPVAVNDTLSVARGRQAKVFVLANDSDADRDLLSIVAFTQPSQGSVELEGQAFVYRPGIGFGAEGDSFEYTISDGFGNTATAGVAISRINALPRAVGDEARGTAGVPLDVAPLANDGDVDGDPLAVSAFTQGARGLVELAGSTLRYTPQAGALWDEFFYTVSDGNGGSATAKVIVSFLSAPPIALADQATVINREWTSISVLTNDDDGVRGGSPVVIMDATHGAQGEVSIKAGTPWFVRYQPYATFAGTDTFTYTIRNLTGQTATATVTVTAATSGNTPPIAVNDSATIPVGGTVLIPVLANDSDADGNVLTISAFSSPQRGTATKLSGQIRYVAGNVAGADSFTYTISDGSGGTATARVDVTITNAPPPPNTNPVAVADSATTPYGTPATISVLANDSDADGNALTIISITQPTSGGVASITGGIITFTPSAGFSGNAVFTYTISDGLGGSATANVTVTVLPAPNRPPLAVADTAATSAATAVDIAALANDSDPDGDPLIIAAISQPPAAQGSATFTASKITFTPATGFAGDALFSYTASDGRGGSATANVTITVRPATPAADIAGAYETNLLDARNEPTGSLAVTVTSTRIATGSLLIGGVPYAFTGTVAASGTLQVSIPRTVQEPLRLALTFTAAPAGGGLISGTLAVGEETHTLVPDCALLATTTSALTGKYTAILSLPAAPALPAGTGWMTLVAENTGALTINGKLADSTAFTAATKLRKDGSFQIYTTPYTGKTGVFAGRLSLTADGTGTLRWSRPAATSGYFASGFRADTAIAISRFTPAPTGIRTLTFPSPAVATLALTGGNAPAAFQRAFSVSTADIFALLTAPADTALTLNRKNGIVTGTWRDTAGQTRNFSGIVFQKTNTAYGHHLGATASGAFSLQ